METKELKLNKDYEIKEINVNLGFTINLGNYESARIDQGLTVKIIGEHTKEEIDLLYKQLRNETRKRVLSEVKRIYNSPIIERE